LAACSFAGVARSYKFVFATFGCVFIRGHGPLLQIRVCNLWLRVRSRAWPAPTNSCLQPLAACSFAGGARFYKFVPAIFACVFVRGRGPLLQFRVCNLWLCVRSRAWPAPTNSCLQPLAVCSFAGVARSYKSVFATFGCVFVRGRGPLLRACIAILVGAGHAGEYIPAYTVYPIGHHFNCRQLAIHGPLHYTPALPLFVPVLSRAWPAPTNPCLRPLAVCSFAG